MGGVSKTIGSDGKVECSDRPVGAPRSSTQGAALAASARALEKGREGNDLVGAQSRLLKGDR